MTALDADVIVRALVQDDPEQGRQAAEVMARPALHVAKSTLLEAERVLRCLYGLPRDRVNAAFRRLLGLETLMMEDRSQVVQALDWHEEGMDFSRALHLSSSSGCDTFATFEKGHPLRGATKLTPRIERL
ncbi:MAG: type II toxin-antitoxin system VapC family toxin [Acidobacteriota bacterium]